MRNSRSAHFSDLTHLDCLDVTSAQKQEVFLFFPFHCEALYSVSCLLLWEAGRPAAFQALRTTGLYLPFGDAETFSNFTRLEEKKLKHGTGGENANHEIPSWQGGIEANKKTGKI